MKSIRNKKADEALVRELSASRNKRLVIIDKKINTKNKNIKYWIYILSFVSLMCICMFLIVIIIQINNKKSEKVKEKNRKSTRDLYKDSIALAVGRTLARNEISEDNFENEEIQKNKINSSHPMPKYPPQTSINSSQQSSSNQTTINSHQQSSPNQTTINSRQQSSPNQTIINSRQQSSPNQTPIKSIQQTPIKPRVNSDDKVPINLLEVLLKDIYNNGNELFNDLVDSTFDELKIVEILPSENKESDKVEASNRVEEIKELDNID